MNKPEKRRKQLLLLISAVGIIPVIWFAMLIAPCFSVKKYAGIMGILKLLEEPFSIIICKSTVSTVLFCLLVYGAFVFYTYSSMRKTRPGASHGNAEFGNPTEVGKRLSDQDKAKRDVIYTDHVHMCVDDRVTRRSIFSIIYGTMGSGKSRFVVIPTIMNMLGSYVVLDPSGELLQSTGKMLEENDYVIKVFNLIDPTKSDFYNPFNYIHKDDDLEKLATSLFKNTTPPSDGGNSQDPFFELMAETLLKAFMYVVYYECPPEEMNFGTIMFMLHNFDVREEDEDFKSPVHIYFEHLEAKNPNHPALGYWKDATSGAGKTAKSIKISLLSHLTKFNSASIQNLTSMDTMELGETGERKTAIFLIIPERDTSYNFLASMLYTSLFDELYRVADTKHLKDGHRLPEFVLFLMDEVANVASPEGFSTIATTARKRNIGIMMFLQAQNQLKTTFKDDAATYLDIADEVLYLGTNSKETMEYFSEMLGDETIDTDSYGISKGLNSSLSRNEQESGIKLMSVSDIRLIRPNEAILLIRGEKPIIDRKYNPKKHRNAKLTTISGGSDRVYVINKGNVGVSIGLTEESVDDLKKNENVTFIELDDIINTYEREIGYDNTAFMFEMEQRKKELR